MRADIGQEGSKDREAIEHMHTRACIRSAVVDRYCLRWGATGDHPGRITRVFPDIRR